MRDRRHRILHILSQRPDSTGSGIYLQAMVREATARGHESFVVAGIEEDHPAGLPGVGSDRRRFVRFSPAGAGSGRADVPYPIVGMSDVMPYPSRRFRDLSPGELDEYERAFTRALTRAAATFRPAIIHSHHLWIVTALARSLFPETPLVVTCHGTGLRQLQSCPGLRERVRIGCRGVNAVMALSESQRQDIVRLHGFPPETIHVVGAGYDDRLFGPGETPDPDPVEIVYAGKLSRAKGVPWLLRALAGIASPRWRLHLVGGGSGEEHAHCLELAGALGERVCVHGAIPQETLAGLLRRAHAFVLPSFFEGLPLVVLEALASGCRVVATDLPGVREVLGGVEADFIRLVRPPRLRSIDDPEPEDESAFVGRLAAALREQIVGAGRTPRVDPSPIAGRLASYTWRSVFGRVERVYAAVRH